MPDKVRDLEQTWQQQTDSFTELAKKTLADHPQPKGGKGKAKNKAK
ncbi:MAG: hypothetical protein NTV46_10930 [Verrucomicrobia bacterium]|nr:hypothetical protein [Verrucomicrobiota bacterium]